MNARNELLAQGIARLEGKSVDDVIWAALSEYSVRLPTVKARYKKWFDILDPSITPADVAPPSAS